MMTHNWKMNDLKGWKWAVYGFGDFVDLGY